MVTRIPGKPGQFDVLVDGELVASRGGSMLKRLLGGGWPDPAEVIEKIAARMDAEKRA